MPAKAALSVYASITRASRTREALFARPMPVFAVGPLDKPYTVPVTSAVRARTHIRLESRCLRVVSLPSSPRLHARRTARGHRHHRLADLHPPPLVKQGAQERQH